MASKQRYDSSFVTATAGLFGEYLSSNNLTTMDAKNVTLHEFWLWCSDRVNDSEFIDEFVVTMSKHDITEKEVRTLLTNWQDPFLFCKSLWIFWPIIRDWYGPKSTTKPVEVRLNFSIIYEDKEFSIPMVERLDVETEKVGAGRVASNWRMFLAVAEKWIMSKNLDEFYNNPSLWSADLDEKITPELDF